MNAPASQVHTLRVQSLFVAYQAQLRSFIQPLLPDFAAADDLVQECFLTVSEKAHEFRLDSSFPAWVRTIARYKILSLARDRARRPEMLSAEVLETLLATAPEPPPREQEESALGTLRQCLSKLAPAAREIIKLRYFSQCGPREISRIRECSANAVNVTLARARETLRRCLENNGSTPSSSTP